MNRLAKLSLIAVIAVSLSGCGAQVDGSEVDTASYERRVNSTELSDYRWNVGETLPIPEALNKHSLTSVSAEQITISESWTQSQVMFTYNVIKGQIIKVGGKMLLITDIDPKSNYVKFKLSTTNGGA